MNINIRVATQQDCPRLLELIQELALYEKAPEEVTVTLAEFEDAGFGYNPVWNAFVVENDQLIIGFALYYTRYSTWKGCRLYLEDFIVTESYRGKGIGKLLFERVMKEAKDKNFNGMNWQVLDWNEPAINFYKKYEAQLDPEWLNGSFSKEQLEK
ncbi:GNAT family acetyltransferase [Pedobacter sp. PACM 27299]|uniref:GNAT family N-acetyltransferase n=1 Tax=Pedobacter sp. PACM 27299 TaxID=1727164 RepID=UPI000705B8F7|nr:GNAT family N-acetyltransferase [Pedobacter sp. PACM 27299]ALL05240.1 GNAT family acetyltransferase [Pedobacter sp. PACM 27299]